MKIYSFCVKCYETHCTGPKIYTKKSDATVYVKLQVLEFYTVSGLGTRHIPLHLLTPYQNVHLVHYNSKYSSYFCKRRGQRGWCFQPTSRIWSLSWNSRWRAHFCWNIDKCSKKCKYGFHTSFCSLKYSFFHPSIPYLWLERMWIQICRFICNIFAVTELSQFFWLSKNTKIFLSKSVGIQVWNVWNYHIEKASRTALRKSVLWVV